MLISINGLVRRALIHDVNPSQLSEAQLRQALLDARHDTVKHRAKKCALFLTFCLGLTFKEESGARYFEKMKTSNINQRSIVNAASSL